MLPEYRVSAPDRLPPLLPASASLHGRLEDRDRALEDQRAHCGARAVLRFDRGLGFPNSVGMLHVRLVPIAREASSPL